MRTVRNITVAVEPELYRQTRRIAADYDTTVTDMVRFLLLVLPEAVKAAHIFIYKDEALFFGGDGWADLRFVVIGAVGSDVVRRSLHDDGVGLGRVFGDVDGGEQADAIAHGNPVFVFGVVRQGVGELGGRGIGERRGGGLGG